MERGLDLKGITDKQLKNLIIYTSILLIGVILLSIYFFRVGRVEREFKGEIEELFSTGEVHIEEVYNYLDENNLMLVSYDNGLISDEQYNQAKVKQTEILKNLLEYNSENYRLSYVNHNQSTSDSSSLPESATDRQNGSEEQIQDIVLTFYALNTSSLMDIIQEEVDLQLDSAESLDRDTLDLIYELSIEDLLDWNPTENDYEPVEIVIGTKNSNPVAFDINLDTVLDNMIIIEDGE